MKPAKRFEIGTSHLMAKGTLKVKRYYEDNDVLMMVYTLNNNENEYTNKYVNIISSIYKWQKKNNITEANTLEEFVALNLVRPLKFGLELELISPISIYEVVSILRNIGINIETPGRIHTEVSGWKLVRDGSISTTRKNPYGFELVSPPSTDFEDLKKICQVLKDEKIKINKSCGMHVHHEIKDLKRQQIMRVYEFYNKYENVIDSSLPESRRNNHYSKPIKNIIDKVRSCQTKSELLSKIGGSRGSGYYADTRYYKINLRSFLFYGTIEFRHHSGSVSYEEITDWILFTHKIIDRAIQVNDNVKQFSEEKEVFEAFGEMTKELKINNTKLEKTLKDKLEKQMKKDARLVVSQWSLAC